MIIDCRVEAPQEVARKISWYVPGTFNSFARNACEVARNACEVARNVCEVARNFLPICQEDSRISQELFQEFARFLKLNRGIIKTLNIVK